MLTSSFRLSLEETPARVLTSVLNSHAEEAMCVAPLVRLSRLPLNRAPMGLAVPARLLPPQQPPS